MLIQILPKLYIGDRHACSQGMVSPGSSLMAEPFACVHAAKHPCYQLKVGKVPASHPHYLWREDPLDLYLNMIDADAKYFQPSLFWQATQFMTHHMKTKRVVVHCNVGKSRAPAIAMVYAVVTKLAPVEFEPACEWLAQKSPSIELSDGLCEFLQRRWKEVIRGKDSKSQAAQTAQGTEAAGGAVQTPTPESKQ